MAPNDVIPKLIEQVPAVAAILILVIIFIKFIEGERSNAQLFFKQLHQSHLDARKEAMDRMQGNTEALKENIIATIRNTDQLSQLSRIVDSWDRRPK